jgi:hypothetical protein
VGCSHRALFWPPPLQHHAGFQDARRRAPAAGIEKTVGEILRTKDGLPDVPTVIYILDGDDFQRYGAGRAGLAGVFYERRYANVITINGGLDFDTVKVAVFHEYTHFIQRNSSTSKMPPWFMEGYAELFSAFKLKGDKVTLGEAPFGVHLYMDQWIPKATLNTGPSVWPRSSTENHERWCICCYSTTSRWGGRPTTT